MKLLRVLLALAVLAYVAALAWPLLAPFLHSDDAGRAAARSGATFAIQAGLDPQRAILWGIAIVAYLLSALLLGSGNPRAALAYGLGFVADILLKLALDRTTAMGRAGDIARSTIAPGAGDGAAGISGVWVVFALLAFLGLLIYAATRKEGGHGHGGGHAAH